MVKVKICGITNFEDAEKSCDLGADYLGFIFIKDTPRVVEPDIAKKIIITLADKAGKVGLFMDEEIDKVLGTAFYCDLDLVQLHGAESPGYCGDLKEAFQREGRSVGIIKALKVSDKIVGPPLEEYTEVDYFVFDTFHPETAGGTGSKFNWDVLNSVKDFIVKPFFLAGGLNPENVADAVKVVNPFGVDVSSGVESQPGRKDENLLKEFIQNAKNA